MVSMMGSMGVTGELERSLKDAQKLQKEAIVRLSTGENDPDQRESGGRRAQALKVRLQGIDTYNKGILQGKSMLQVSDSALANIGNLIQRMREIHLVAASDTMSDTERRYSLSEYQVLYDEVTRVAQETHFNNVRLLASSEDSDKLDKLTFVLGDPYTEGGDLSEHNVVHFEDIDKIDGTAAGLGLPDFSELIEDSEVESGIPANEVLSLLSPENDAFATAHDEATAKINTFRSIFGSIQVRLEKASSYLGVLSENIAQARSAISDSDYAKETAKLMQANIKAQASTALLSHVFDSQEANVAMLGSLL